MAKEAQSSSSGDKSPTTTNPTTDPKTKEETSPTEASKASKSWMYPVAVALISVSAAGLIASPSLRNSFVSSKGSSSSSSSAHRNLNAAAPFSASQPQYQCDNATLSEYLHEDPVPGMHVVCLQEDAHTLTLFPSAQIGNSVDVNNPEGWDEWEDLRDVLSWSLQLRPTDRLHQPWSSFSPTGERMLDEVAPGPSSTVAFQEKGLFLILQGGQWIWPGVHKGFRRRIQLEDVDHETTLETLSLVPLVVSVEGFLSKEECSWIQDTAAPDMEYSEVMLMDKDKGRPASDWRTSQTTFLSSDGPEIKVIDRRTASLVRIPQTHQESAQVLRYGKTEKYDPHHDFFDPAFYQQDASTLEMIQHGRRNRMATVFWYLSDVEEGGETVFPRMDGKFFPNNQVACEYGLRVRPEEGKVIIFYSLTPDGNTDDNSLHGACPVKEGIKWAANKWVWNDAMGFVK